MGSTSVQSNHSVLSDSRQPYGLQHTRHPCHHQLPELTQTHVHQVGMPSNLGGLMPCPLSSPSPTAFNFSSIRVFSNEAVLRIRWPKYQSLSFNISPSNEYSGLISFRRNWLDLLAVQGTLKSLLKHQSSKASILQFSALFIVQLSHPYMTTGKTIVLTIWTFICKRISLLFNMLSSFYVKYSFSSKEQVSFNFMAAGTICSDFGAQDKASHCFHYFPIHLP